jgi:hypothetical protein
MFQSESRSFCEKATRNKLPEYSYWFSPAALWKQFQK